MSANRITPLVLIFVLLTACGGRSANPVPSYRVGDASMSCGEIRVEMGYVDSQVARLVPESKKTGKNVALAVTGWFLIVPWFFMDLSDAEKVEIRAYQERYLALEKLWTRAQCDGDGPVIRADTVEEAASKAPIATRLEVLEELFEQGVISKEELESRRSEILDEI